MSNRFFKQSPLFISAGFVMLPVLVILSSWVDIDGEIWRHLWETQLVELAFNTILLLVGVGVGSSVLGLSSAWLVTAYDFRGRGLFSWALVLPLAMPAYVLAFVLLGALDYGSPLALIFSDHGVPFVNLRSPFFVCFILSLVFYPYVFLLCKAAFEQQGLRSLEAARSLGVSGSGVFYKVVLPIARPALVGGVSLVLMETLADFGAVSIFNYNTLTTAIYKSWSGFFSLATASQLASILLLLAGLMLFSERATRRSGVHEKGATIRRTKLFGLKSIGATIYLAMILTCAFVGPVIQLGLWAYSQPWTSDLFDLVGVTSLLGSVAAVVILFFSVLATLSRRHFKSKHADLLRSIAGMGYALPGSVLAVGVMLAASYLDKWFGTTLLSASVVLLLMAYVARFFSVGINPIESSYEKITPSMWEASRLMSTGRRERYRRILVPLMTPSLLLAALLVLIDVMKEMPATLLLRPFGWDTLAVRIYEFTSEGEWEMAAVPALTLVVLSLLPVYLLVRKSSRHH